MTGRNNRPDKDGAASKPSRLDQFGDQLAKNDKADRRGTASVPNCKP